MNHQKEFNVTGTCIPHFHYMVPLDLKIQQIMGIVEKGKYFTMNRPRQYGKTTTLFFLFKELQKREEYLPIQISLEGIDEEQYHSTRAFLEVIFLQLGDSLHFQNEYSVDHLFESSSSIISFPQFGVWLSKLIGEIKRKVIFLIDEVDQAGNYPIFFDFLGFLRTRYLAQLEGRGQTFHSVVLAGVHDVKNLKTKILPDREQQYNSPWNIAADFKVKMSFSSEEIAAMLEEYSRERNVPMDCLDLGKQLNFYTSGYPFLVSRLCQFMDQKSLLEWNRKHLAQAVLQLLRDSNTNFDHLIKNMENDPDLYQVVEQIVLKGTHFDFNQHNSVLARGILYGIFRDEGQIRIHNRIYEQLLLNYMTANLNLNHLSKNQMDRYQSNIQFQRSNSTLDLELVFFKFMKFMKEQYLEKDQHFIERNGRLIFLSFLQPILNGKGYAFKEVETAEEKRMDLVVTFLNERFVIELKIWYGEKSHERGLKQLAGYLEHQSLEKGYLLIFNFNQAKEWKQETVKVDEKTIFITWV